MRIQQDALSYHNKGISHTNSFFLFACPDLSRLRKLREEDRDEVVAFLNLRPVHTIAMTSFINDNGIENPSNRGIFYGYCGMDDKLEGVALIGHSTLIEARNNDAIRAFALAAKGSETQIKLVMSSDRVAELFWLHYTDGLRQPRLASTEILFEVAFPFLVQNCEWDIRTAKPEELTMVAEAHAEVALIESGVDPMQADRNGFLERALDRIKKGRTFVVVEDGTLIFKADIVAETDNVVYLEGVYVSPARRGKGIGASCMAKLNLQLLEKVQNICLLSNESHSSAHKCFEKAGYKRTGKCTALFV